MTRTCRKRLSRFLLFPAIECLVIRPLYMYTEPSSSPSIQPRSRTHIVTLFALATVASLLRLLVRNRRTVWLLRVPVTHVRSETSIPVRASICAATHAALAWRRSVHAAPPVVTAIAA